MNYSFTGENATDTENLLNTTSATPEEIDDSGLGVSSIIIMTVIGIVVSLFLYVGFTICCENVCECGNYCEYINRLCFIKPCLTNKEKNNIIVIELTELVIAQPVDATETCPICLENIKKGDQLGSLPCGHKHFHKQCLDQWMQVSDKKSCPMCRKVSI